MLKCGIFIENVPVRKIKVGVTGVSSWETTETVRYLVPFTRDYFEVRNYRKKINK
jgi:hypothetical protein